MKLYLKDGKVMFDYEGEISDIFSFNACGFKLLPGGVREFVPTGDVNDDYDQLSLALLCCENDNVEIDKAVVDYVDVLKAGHEKFLAERLAERERQQAIEKAKKKWEHLNTYGCGMCSDLKRWNDDHICAYTKKVLEEKSISKTAGKAAAAFNGVFYACAIAPYPCEGCKFEFKEEL